MPIAGGRGTARRRVAVIAVAVAGAAALLTSMITSGGPAAANTRAAAQPATAHPAAAAARTFSNPVLGPGQDPSVLTYRGWYYFTQLAPDGKNITIRRARSIKSLAAAPKTTVWSGGRSGSPCCDWWAPELHHLNGACLSPTRRPAAGPRPT